MRKLLHEELKGGYTIGKKIIVSAIEITNKEYEIMALYEDGEELDSCTTDTEDKAITCFNDFFNRYAEPLQKAVYNGKLKEGNKYTLVYLNDFGFPIAQKITFHSIKCCTYAQYSDCVKMTFTPYKKRNKWEKIFYNCSLMIFEGWQNIKESDTHEVISTTDSLKVTKSKYSCFDARYIDDLEKAFKNPLVVYKNYKTGCNGKTYA